MAGYNTSWTMMAHHYLSSVPAVITPILVLEFRPLPFLLHGLHGLHLSYLSDSNQLRFRDR